MPLWGDYALIGVPAESRHIPFDPANHRGELETILLESLRIKR
jgi:hypothetical protein